MAYPLPRNDDALKAMVIQFINASNGNLTILGLTSAQVLDLTAAVTEFDIKLVDKYVRAVDAKAATAAKDDAKDAMLNVLRPLIRIVRGHDVPTALLDQLGIGGITPPAPVQPDQPLLVTVTPFANGTNWLRWEAGGNKKGTQYVIEVMNATTEGWEYLATSSRISYRHLGQQPGTTQSYRVFALRKGVLSVPSFPVTVYGPAGAGEVLHLAA